MCPLLLFCARHRTKFGDGRNVKKFVYFFGKLCYTSHKHRALLADGGRICSGETGPGQMRLCAVVFVPIFTRTALFASRRRGFGMKRQGRKKEMLFRSQADEPFCQTDVCDPYII